MRSEGEVDMAYQLAPTGLAAKQEHEQERRVGRFAETRGIRAARVLFRLLCAVAPGMAARAGYALLARPPRPPESRWQTVLREKARSWRLADGMTDLVVYEWGRGPVVLLVHGWGSHALHMGRMVNPLVKAGFRVVAFDAPAHGRSAGTETDMIAFASAIAAVASRVGPLHAVIGHSFGAAMALYAQRDWGVHAGRLVLVSAFDHCNWFIEAFGAHVGLSHAVLERMRQELVRRYGGRFDWGRMSVADMLRHCPVPALVVHDEGDEEVPFQHGLALVCVSQHAELLATRGCGHQRLVRNPPVIQRIVQFVA